MKATLTTLLALAMLSGTAFADTPTYVSSSAGEIVVDNPDNPNYLYGIYKAEEEGSALGADVAIHEEAYGTNSLHRNVWGGYTEDWSSSADSNKVRMTSGLVTSVTVGEAYDGGASDNTLTMEGGEVLGDVYVGLAITEGCETIGNVAIVTGGTVNGQFVVGNGYGEGSTVNYNKLHLVGEGAEAEIADAQGNTATYTGSSISLGQVVVADADGGATAESNSIDIYGAGIEATGLSGFDQLNFHIVDGLTTTGTPMVSVAGELDLSQLTARINLFGDAVTNWNAFEGQEITLASATDGIIRPDFMTTEEEQYSILDASGATVATATLRVVGYEMCPQSIVMSNIQGVPEPTTGTLSLLALAGLCIRRRK